MLKFDWKKIINYFCVWLILGIVFLVPVYFSFVLPGFNVFELPKIVLFKVLVIFLLFFSVAKFFFEDEPYKNLSVFKENKIVYGVVGYMLAVCLIMLASMDIINSLLGSYNRQQGFVSYIFYFIFFVLLVYNIRKRSEVNIVFQTAVLSSVLVCVYGLLQATGWEYFHWSEPFSATGRITSTFGQPNYLASYLLIVIPLSVYLFKNSQKLWAKFCWIIVLALQLASLFFTYSRAGWLGLLGGAFFTIFIFFVVKKENSHFSYIKSVFFPLLAIVLLIAVLLLNNNFSTRVKSLYAVNSGSNTARMHFWGAGWQMILKKPIFGYGLENSGNFFAGKYQKDWATFGDVNDFPDRAHSLPLDILLSGGIIVFIFYFGLLLITLGLLIQKWKRSGDWIFLVLIGSLVSYVISLFFGFDVPGMTVYFWLLLALSAVVTKNDNVFKTKINILKPVKALVLLAIFLLAIFVCRWQFRLLLSDYYFRDLQNAAYTKQYFQVYELYGYIEQNKATNKYYDRYLSGLIFDWAYNSDDRTMRRGAQNILLNIVERNKNNNYYDVIIRAKAETVLAVDDVKYKDKAISDFSLAISLAPEIPGVYLDNSKSLRLLGKTVDSMKSLDEAWKNLPNFIGVVGQERQRNLVERQRYLIDIVWGDLYLDEKKYDQAIKAYDFASKYNPDDNYINKKIANVYYSKKDYQKAIDYNKEGMRRDQANYFWPFSLALLYKEIGDKNLALSYAQQAQNLSKDNGEVKRLVDELTVVKK